MTSTPPPHQNSANSDKSLGHVQPHPRRNSLRIFPAQDLLYPTAYMPSQHEGNHALKGELQCRFSSGSICSKQWCHNFLKPCSEFSSKCIIPRMYVPPTSSKTGNALFFINLSPASKNFLRQFSECSPRRIPFRNVSPASTIFLRHFQNILPEDSLLATISTSTMSVSSNLRAILRVAPYPTGRGSRVRSMQSSTCATRTRRPRPTGNTSKRFEIENKEKYEQ